MTPNGTPREGKATRSAFREWRRSRPFWGGLLILLAGIVIVAAPALNPLDLIVQQGIAGVSGYFSGLLLMAVGVLVWLQPPQRIFYGVAAVLLSLVSFITSNFGGFVFGMLFGLVGGALTAAWVPHRERREPAGERGRAGAERAIDRPGGGAGEGAAGEAGDEAAESGGDETSAETGAPERDRAAARDEAAPARSPAEGAEGAAGTVRGGAGVGGATYFTSLEGPPGGDSAGRRRRRAADDPASGGGSGAGGSSGGDRLHSLAAVAAALAIAVPVPATVTWPWDDWFGGGEETPAPGDPSATPTPTSSPAPSPSGGADGSDGGTDGGTGTGGQEGQDGSGRQGEEEPPTAAECEVQEGPSAMGEEEYRALLEACRQAKEDGEAPEFQVHQGDGRWLAHTETSGLSADELSMEGAAFEGVVEYPVEGGTVRYLKLTMDTAEFTGARQWSEHDGTTTSLGIPAMTMSGDVVMHVTRMKVRILGIPLEFTPDFPPPLLLPSMTVTDLEADQPLAQARTVEITGLDERVKP
ncbi:DUF6114 domain-containing protein [Streptomonospora wellingtoniae]|uniref:DUF6114 domain-containing protein n=1 Tax=Streptomonospora wellingtoniae TaxID=3075544 RepID=A0ABU2KSD2_9ACTN|nr:DUF6114 domain-containing protein [Streptomonospora sp. DSM 45055]MDT0302187.1 DUF6114 domain-containing protein [Streptomonospora sp. DSM 45055]